VRPSSLSRIERDRVVNQVLATELAGRVHALSLATQTPEESDR
jgi:stress-induced morphogen